MAGSSRIASREVRIPFVKKNRIQSIIQENATDYFPIDISGYVLSYSMIDIESKEARDRRCHPSVSSDGLCSTDIDFCCIS